jgi:hypothetical protein
MNMKAWIREFVANVAIMEAFQHLKRSTGWFKAIAWNILGKWSRAAMCKAPKICRFTCYVVTSLHF